MKNKNIKGYIILALVLVVFSVIAFAAPFSMKAPFWIAYIFGVIAIAFQLYVFSIAFSKGDDVKSRFYGFPIAKIGIVYLIVQLVISLVQMGLAFIIPVWVCVIINIVIAAVAVIGCIAAETMRDEIERQDVQLKKDVSNMRKLQSLSASLVAQCSDDQSKAVVQKMADEFRYSDPVSSDETLELEKELNMQLEELQMSVLDGDTEAVKEYCKKISGSLAERNRICALNK